MQITHLGHSCLLLEWADARVLVDPGTFTPDLEFVEGVDAVVVTHQHPDHLDVSRLPAVLEASPGARVLGEPDAVDALAGAGITATAFAAGDHVSLGSMTMTGVGGQHAVIHPDIPRIGNTGLVFSAEGSPTLFHPGDMIDTAPPGVDLLALPLSAPWCAFKETVEFVRAVAPGELFPIHDAIVSAIGRNLYLTQTRNLSPDGTEIRDLAGAGPVTF